MHACSLQGTLEVDDILSVGPTHRLDAEGRPEFVILCTDRVEKFVANDQDDLDDWVRVLSPKRRGTANQDNDGTRFG
jgi:hypothetical protein